MEYQYNEWNTKIINEIINGIIRETITEKINEIIREKLKITNETIIIIRVHGQ